jgi:DNA polymerase I-like protein with 3'-5' exonuclease and polymerase domains
MVDDIWHGFLPNVRDTAIGSSYVDENRSRGLKSLSKDLLGYEQETYDSATTKEYLKSAWNGKGKVLGEWQEEDGAEWVKVQHKMNELTARQVLSYGADDTICTAAVAVHFRCVMEIEKTWHVYEQVETYPAYLTALAFVQGTAISLEDMRAMEKEDDAAYDAAAPVLRQYLMDIGFDGTQCPVYTEMTPANIKEGYQHITGREHPKTLIRTLSKLAKLLEVHADELTAEGEDDIANKVRVLSIVVGSGEMEYFNKLVAENFNGEPKLDLASPKQMKELLYTHMKLPVKVINDVTPLEKEKNPELFAAVQRFKKIRAGSEQGVLTDEQKALMKLKAKTDDTAIDFALAFDADVIDDAARAALKAIGVMKSVMTRRSLFYKNYWNIRHWKDGLVHAQANQCAAVTRRYSMSNPNLQQLPKKGEAVKFRGIFKPHKRNAVVTSIDFVGQELRLAAERSQDKNMLACYVGSKLKDIHSITAAGALEMKWGREIVDELRKTYGADLDRSEDGTYDLFLRLRKLGKNEPVGKKADDLRKDAKNVNFGAQNGAKAVKLSETLVMPVEDAQLFLDARSAMFPGVDEAAERAAEEAKRTGYALTFMGARRHLREAIMSDEKGAADRAARQAWNFEIQGSAGEMTKLAMAEMWVRGIFFKYDARFIAPIHDELVDSVTREDAVEFLREKHACMTKAYSTMKVPILGSISFGPDFADQYECGDWFIEENIRKSLNDIFEMKEAA